MSNIRTLISDKLMNVVSGLGMFGKDKRASDVYTIPFLTQEQIEASYRGDWIARKVVDIIPRDMTREWRSWQATKSQIERLEGEERRLQLRVKVGRAKTLARLYGGSAIIIGDGAKDPTQRLVADAVGLNGIKFLHVLNRYQITCDQLERDPMSPFFGEPQRYQLNTGTEAGVFLHPSRVVRFIGAELPDQIRNIDQGWGDSILMALLDAVHNASSTQENLASLISEAKLDIIRIPELMSQIATSEYEGRLVKRFQTAMLGKSTLNTLIMDKDEEWSQRQLSLTGMPEIIRAYLEVAAGAADIPLVRLLGVSPTGLSATGAADIRNYYDNVASQQHNDLSPNLERIDELVIRSALGRRPPSVHYVWNSLWQMTDAEKADNCLKKSQATNLYGRLGVMSREALATAVQNQLVEDGLYPGLADVLKEPGATKPSDPIGGPAPSNGAPDKPNPVSDKQPDLFEA